MKFNYVILGSGRQGVALAYDLAKNGEAARVTLADADEELARRGIERLRRLLSAARNEPAAPENGAPGCEWFAARCDVTDAAAVRRAIAGATVVVSAVPYRFNVALTDAAIAARAGFCDLGGNTDVVRQQLARHGAATAAGVSVVPDCGLAPGLGNTLAAHGIASMDSPQHVHIRCGGLPQERVGPLNYKLVFNFDGLINEYSGSGEFLRKGKLTCVPALTELEDIDFPPPVGRCEAAVTSGGTSTCPHTFAGKLQSYDYKTVRYPGHFAVIRALFELGCFDERVTLRDQSAIEPKQLLRRLFEERLSFPQVRDLVVLRVMVSGVNAGRPTTVQYDLYDVHDGATGFTAMERTTAFPAALVAYMQARGVVQAGARPLEVGVPARPYVDQLARHDIRVAVRTA